MAPKGLGEWPATDDSHAAGDAEAGEPTGHRSGRRIVEIERKTKDELTEADLDHMQTVVGYVHRHLAQTPSGSVEDTDWRYSLMHWGHDPCEDDDVDGS